MACLRAGDDPRAVAALKAALADPDEIIRLEAGNAADRIGDRARALEKELEACRNDPRNQTTYPARVANRVLNRLRGSNDEVR